MRCWSRPRRGLRRPSLEGAESESDTALAGLRLKRPVYLRHLTGDVGETALQFPPAQLFQRSSSRPPGPPRSASNCAGHRNRKPRLSIGSSHRPDNQGKVHSGGWQLLTLSSPRPSFPPMLAIQYIQLHQGLSLAHRTTHAIDLSTIFRRWGEYLSPRSRK